MEKEELELLKSVLPMYLNHKLKIEITTVYGKINHPKKAKIVTELNCDYLGQFLNGRYVKPILRPSSDLFIKRFDDENGGLRHIDIISSKIFFDNHIDNKTSHESFWHRLINSEIYPTLNQSKELLDFLYKNHYDVEALFNNGKGLIEKGLAIDKNKLNN